MEELQVTELTRLKLTYHGSKVSYHVKLSVLSRAGALTITVFVFLH